MAICDKVAVLNEGRLLAAGTPQEVRNNREVVTAYVGED
jgi:branched-chain amino acid transport system ATP-binding protein